MPQRRSPVRTRSIRTRPRSPTETVALDPVNRRFLVFGRVQGVYFRHSTRAVAMKLAIRGAARNLADGSVEVVAHGSAVAVEELKAWLQQGPAQARVDEVRETAADDGSPVPEEFLVL
jgi:acylphosphatase